MALNQDNGMYKEVYKLLYGFEDGEPEVEVVVPLSPSWKGETGDNEDVEVVEIK